MVRPRSECSAGGPVALCFICPPPPPPPIMARGPSVPAYHSRGLRGPGYHLPFCSICLCYGMRPVIGASAPWVAQLSFAFCFICPPLWCADRAGQLTVCLSTQFASLWPAAQAGRLIMIILRSAYHLRGPSRPVCHLPLCLICGAPRSVCNALHGRGGGGGGRLIILSRMVTVASMPKTAKCACVVNKVNRFESM